jgi:hypothetical protein
VKITAEFADEWTIDFLDGWTINGLAFTTGGNFLELGEPEGGRGKMFLLENKLTPMGGEPGSETQLRWESEIEIMLDSPIPIRQVVKNGLVEPLTGNKFDVIVADVPELSSTISIFGIALAGLAWFARFRRRAM